jgi:hypothetical protein
MQGPGEEAVGTPGSAKCTRAGGAEEAAEMRLKEREASGAEQGEWGRSLVIRTFELQES